MGLPTERGGHNYTQPLISLIFCLVALHVHLRITLHNNDEIFHLYATPVPTYPLLNVIYYHIITNSFRKDCQCKLEYTYLIVQYPISNIKTY